MSGDLVAKPHEVHDDAQEVLSFWFEEVPPERCFARDAALDAAIADRFARIRDEVVAGEAHGWRGDAETLVAAVIAADQFSRHLFRGSAEAFAGDALALNLAREAMRQGWDRELTVEQRTFLYMPLMHAEDRAAQAESIAAFEALGDADNLKFARDHEAVIARFGRYPGRNAALGRVSTAEEVAFLAGGGADW
ncbi:DUF924 family protein [Sphingomonas hylomeconis]|uniref:DUF924 family protein n=1 Tax=Sphingomonas hylomeconis TaxID=1395958 RepID=A0ABV7SUD0_9SPHN|nr:DUF924 family protein [Sphingomonas hylomeconis]